MEYEHKPYLVQRLRVREPWVADSRVADSRVADSRVADSRVADPHLEEGYPLLRCFEFDRMGAAEFEHGIVGEAMVQACKKARTEEWGSCTIAVSNDIVVYYLGPESRFQSATKFLNTQLINDESERYMAERPLKETTCLKHSYLCQDEKCRLSDYRGWWCLDIDHQFAFFKTPELAQLFLSALLATNWKKIRAEDFTIAP